MPLQDVIQRFNPRPLTVTRRSAGRIVDGYLVPVDEIDQEVDLDGTTDVVTLAAHGLATGSGPFQIAAVGGAFPTSLSATGYYWIIKLDDNTFKLAASYAAAVATPTPFPINFGAADVLATYSIFAPETFPITAGVQEVAGRELDDQPEGQSGSQSLKLWTTTLLLTRMPPAGATPGREPDTVAIDWLGQTEDWTVTKVEQYLNISRHYVVTVERDVMP